MQTRSAIELAAITAVMLLLGAPAMGGEYTSVEIGHTGEHLRNSAMHQDKFYEGAAEQAALLGRIACLMKDVDRLLYRLHALPPEISVDPPVMQPVDAELALLYGIGLRENPALAVPRSELAVLAARTRQEGAPEDPMLSVELMDLAAPVPLLFDPQKIGMEVGVSQLLNTYGKRGLQRSIAQRDEGLKELELAQMELELLLDITNIYYELMGTRAGIRALDANIELMNILLELAGRKYSLGLTPQSMLLNAQVQLTLMEKERIEMRTMAQQQGAALDGLLGHPIGFNWEQLSFDAAYPVPPRIEWNTPQLLQTTLARRPDYQALEQQKDQQLLRVELAHREYHPDVTVMGAYESSRMSQDTLRVGIQFPLLLNKEERQDAAVQEQYAGVAVLDDRMAELESELEAQVRQLQLELAMHGELVDLYRGGVVPQARLALDSSIAGYAANMMDFSELTMSQQTLLTQERELELNHIHILHTLADLQILTVGAFDPSPYYVPQLEPSGAAVGTPVELQPGQAMRLDAGPADPRAESGFLDGLELPGRSPLQLITPPEPELDAAASSAGLSSEVAAQESGDDSAATELEPGQLDQFYDPYEPEGETSSDE